MKILLAEDDQLLAKLIVRMLKKEWQVVEWVADGEAAFEYAAGMHYDLVILDWMLPKISGVEVSRKLRSSGFEGAVLLLTARGDVDDRVEGLDAGADDYLVKPFEFKELFARIRALSRRGMQTFEQEAIQFKDLEIRLNSRTVHRGSQLIQLTPKEFQMLELFIRNRNQVISKEIIIERLWGLDSEATANTVEATVKLLRKKLNGKHYIQTVRGSGYMLSDADVR